MAIFRQPTWDNNGVALMFTFYDVKSKDGFFSDEDKILVKVLRQDKGYSAKEKKRSGRRKHCALVVVRKNFAPPQNSSRGRGTAKI